MPVTKTAKKALRVSERRRVINFRTRSKVKTFVDKMKATPTAENLASAFRAVDRAVKSNIMHRNKAARMKSKLHSLLPKS